MSDSPQPASAMQQVAQVAEEFLEKVNGQPEGDAPSSDEKAAEGKMSLEARKAKMEELRKKMVCNMSSRTGVYAHEPRSSVLRRKPTERRSLRRAQRRR